MLNANIIGKMFRHVTAGQSLRMASTLSQLKLNTLEVSTPKKYVYQVQLNRPEKYNALTHQMWLEIAECFKVLEESSDCRAVLLTAAGKAFCAGLDLQEAMTLGQQIAEHDDVARKCRLVEKRIKQYQDAFLSIERCRKPVIAAIHGLCVGGAFNMISAADIRYCSTNAWFSLMEVEIGMAADVGALQWLPRIIGSSSLARELAYTGRKMPADEALACGFVSKLFKEDETLFDESLKLAESIANRSPVAVQTTKRTMVYSADHTVQDGLDYVRNINQTMLQSEDFISAAMAKATKTEQPIFSKL